MKNNKGFSLVELIVVIAIMAVLVGVLAPTLLRYVEKSRTQKDESAVAEVLNAVKIAIADENIYDGCVFASDTSATTVTVTVSGGGITVANWTAPTGYTGNSLEQEIKATCGDTIAITSKTHTADTSYEITLKSATEVTGEWK